MISTHNLQINNHIIATGSIAYLNLNQPRDGEHPQNRSTAPGVRLWLRQQGVNLASQIGHQNGGAMPAYLDFFGNDAVPRIAGGSDRSTTQASQPNADVPAQPLDVAPSIAPYFEKTTGQFRGKPEQALAWIRNNPGSFAAGAPEWRGRLRVSHIDAKRVGYLDEAIHTIPPLPVVDTTTDKTGRVLGKVLVDGPRRAVGSADLRGNATPEWLLTSYERSAPAASSGVSEASKAGSGPTPPGTERPVNPAPATRVGVRGAPQGAGPTPPATGDSTIARDTSAVNSTGTPKPNRLKPLLTKDPATMSPAEINARSPRRTQHQAH